MWNFIAGRTVEKGASWGRNKHTHRKAVEPVTYLAELVRQPAVKCFQFDTHKCIILQNEEMKPLSCIHGVFGKGTFFFFFGNRIPKKCTAISCCLFLCTASMYAYLHTIAESLKYFFFPETKAVGFKIQENTFFLL